MDTEKDRLAELQRILLRSTTIYECDKCGAQYDTRQDVLDHQSAAHPPGSTDDWWR